MSKELSRCPFCGGEAEEVPKTNIVWCKKNGCRLCKVPIDYGRWQDRPIESELRGEIERLKDELLEVTHGEELYGVQIDEDEDAQYMVPEGIMKYVEEVNLNWHKDREQIKSLTAEVGRLKEAIEYYLECLDAASHEGLEEMIVEENGPCLADLLNRRLLYDTTDKFRQALKGEQK